MGMAPHQFLINARLDHAAELLGQSHAPIKHVAVAAGYEDIYHFTRAFKRRHGQPPAAYRREIRNVQINDGNDEVPKTGT